MHPAWWGGLARLQNSRTCASYPRQPEWRWEAGLMKALRWLSDTLRRLNPRERRVVLGGAIVSATALLVVLVGLPLTHHWTVRETAYTASREQWLRLRMLVTNTDRLRRALEERKRAHAADEARLVTGATPPPPAPALQGPRKRHVAGSS